jgi:hypothetical protein
MGKENEVGRLQDVLRRGLSFALDASGRRARFLSLRTEEARFLGIDSNWEAAQHELRGEGRGLLVELVAASPYASAVTPDLEEPLANAERAFEAVLSAIVNVELEEPALALWEQVRSQTLEQLRNMRDGRPEYASCVACGRTFLQDPDDVVKHFAQVHHKPAPSERRLISTEYQREAIEVASKEFRAAHDETIHLLTAAKQSSELAEREPSSGGRPPHLWKGIILEKAKERKRLNLAASTQRAEAGQLRTWAIELPLPLEPKKARPSIRTVEEWVAGKRS